MQQSALQKMAGGARKIILSTSIAETSLTIDGVSVVVDAGLVRTAQFDPRRGMSRLLTTRVSQATATQRAGRAGRQQAGACYRLWSAEQHKMLAQFPTPEIAHSDLMPLTLELAQWGVDEKQLAFLSAPPAAHLQQAREKLQILGALDTEQKITAHGRAMVALPVHPRYAHMLLRANEHGMGALACDVAALLDERDVLRGEKDADFYLRWTALQHGGAVDRGARERVKLQVKRLRQMLAISNDSVQHEDKVGLMLALCYPERVARRRDERGERWQLASGAGAVLTGHSILMRELWIAVADLDGDGRDARIYLAAAVQEEDLATFLSELFFSGEEVVWSTQEEAVLAREVQRFGAIIVKEKKLPARGDAVARVLCGGLRQAGWNNLPISDPAQQWLQRVRWLSDNNLADNFPSFDEAHLLATLEDWALPFLKGITRRNQLSQVDWLAALQSRLDYAQQQMLDRLAPAHLVVPTGSRIALDYSGAQPVLPVRLQEMFGAKDTPRIADGKVPVLIHLLSPRQMPLAVTQDLASFWQNAYKEVRKDMRGQYPKHYWPENPLEAEPTRRTKAADDRARKKLS
jgi:ATP-dependent helicase HrpB